MSLWYDFISLIYPEVCLTCGNTLLRHEKFICNYCFHELPATDFHLHADNPVSRVFWGRVRIHACTSQYYFSKGTRVQHLIHKLKYKGKKEIGLFLGRIYGRQLKGTELFGNVDIIVPVPLHPKKKRKRGYNQSDLFAEGLAESMGCSTDLRSLIRTVATESQTKKKRFSRWENVKEVFLVKSPEAFKGKHVLLVDDVITTGATLEACAKVLLDIPDVRVSFATIACAVK